MDRAVLDQLQQRVSTLPARLIPKVYKALRPKLYRALQWNLADRFICCVPPRMPPDDSVLTIRTGKLFNSVLKSLKFSEKGGTLTVSIGSNLPYAAIHEYGGYAGRHRAYIRPRPYLGPTMDDLEEIMPLLLDLAISEVTGSYDFSS